MAKKKKSEWREKEKFDKLSGCGIVRVFFEVPMTELADVTDSKSVAARRAGSTPARDTIFMISSINAIGWVLKTITNIRIIF